MTGAGIILGTAAYMSPEQARGRVVDKRTDIWAFGVVLYEMLTGKRAFEGEDGSLTLAAVMKSEPDFTALPRDLPAAIRVCLARCLQKDSKQRLRDIGDAGLVMDRAFDAIVSGSSPATTPSRPLWRRAFAPTAAAVVAGTLAALAMWNARAPEPKHVTRFEHLLPNQVPFKDSNRPLIAVSPDGRRLAYNAADGLYLHTLAEAEDRRLIARLANLSGPFFSPDGEQVGYHDGTRLQRVPVSGGAPIPIAETANPFGATWADDDRIYFAAGGSLGGIWRVEASGGTPELVIPSENGQRLSSPQVMPNGDTILFAASVAAANSVMLRSMRSGQQTVLVDGASNPRYVATGHLLYTIGDDLFAAAFDPQTRATRAGVPVVAGIRRGVAPGGSQIANDDVARDGSLVYVPVGSDQSAHQLVWVTRDGKATPITAIGGAPFASPRLSSDDRRALVVAHGDARIYELATGRETRITTDGVTGVYAEWVPGEQSVAYSSTRRGKEGPMNVWVHPLDGSGNAYQLTTLKELVHLDAFAPDGRSLAVHHHPGTSAILLTLSHAANANPKPLYPGAVRQDSAVFSPDGRYIAYLDNITDRSEVVIRPFPGPGPPTPVSVGGAREPAWARNGELFYRRLVDDAMMVVRVTTSPALAVGQPTELFRGPGHPGGSPRASYAVTADGTRFLMSAARVVTQARESEAPLPRVKVVLNFLEEVKQRVPAR